MSQQPLDDIPVFLFVAIFVLINLVAYEIGFRTRAAIHKKAEAPADDGPTGMIVGSILALMAFLLAITMGMASDRYDNRRGLVLAEANALGTTYLRAGYLSEPNSSEMQDLIREYVPLRIGTSDRAQLAINIAESESLQDVMWRIAEDEARTNGSDVTALFIESLNEVIDLHESRDRGRDLRPRAADDPLAPRGGRDPEPRAGRLQRRTQRASAARSSRRCS